MSDEQQNDMGSILKQARERQGISLESVHEATKIPLDSLKAIEEGYKVRTLSPFYYKSFVKIYAQYLGLNAADIVARISPPSTTKSAPASVAAPAAQARPKPLPVRAPGPVAKKVQETMSLNLIARSFDPRRGKKIAAVVAAVVGGVIAVFIIGAVVKKIQVFLHEASLAKAKAEASQPKVKAVKKAPESKRTEEASKPEEPRKMTASVPAEVPQVKKQEASQANPPVENSKSVAGAPDKKADEDFVAAKGGKTATVTVRAQANAWLTVKADGKSVSQGILKKGNAETWNATKKIEISGKDVDQLVFEVNGKNIGKLSRRDTKARKVVITPEGLTVEK